MITDRARCYPTNNVYLDLQNCRYFTYIFVISFIGGENQIDVIAFIGNYIMFLASPWLIIFSTSGNPLIKEIFLNEIKGHMYE
jgi:hypothetical protein